MPTRPAAVPLEAMLATAGPVPTGPGWILEPKWDGMRALASVDGPGPGGVRLISRNQRRVTGSFPELAAALVAAAGGRALVLDGEIVALGAPGDGTAAAPSFDRLQQRIGVARPRPGLLARVPVTYMAFDVLAVDDRDVTGLAYRERRALLEGLGLDTHPRVQVSPVFEGLDGATALALAEAHGLEGLVAKRRSSTYRAGRQPSWVKTPLWRSVDAVIGGWAPGRGRHARTLGSLLLGAPTPSGGLRYLGHIGTGLREVERAQLRDQLADHETATSPFTTPVPDQAQVRWVAPRLVAEARYRAWTEEGLLRHASWRGLRPDRDPAELAGCPPGDE